jgi:hypothetical protein
MVLNATAWVLDWMQRIDTVANHSEQLGRLLRFLQTQWGVVVSVGGGALLIAAALFLRGGEETAPIAPKETPPIDAVPDWPIRELFLHLRPSLGTDNDTAHEGVAMDIKDKLSQGQLKIWGRRKTHWGDPLPLSEIDRAYWQDADFTYWFLAGYNENEQTCLHDAHKETVLPIYLDLQVNKAQALALWPVQKSGGAA